MLFGGFLFFWVVAICARLVYLQVFQYGALVQRAARQQQRTIEVSPQRGIIYDRNGQELAMSVLVGLRLRGALRNSRPGDHRVHSGARAERRRRRKSWRA